MRGGTLLKTKWNSAALLLVSQNQEVAASARAEKSKDGKEQTKVKRNYAHHKRWLNCTPSLETYMIDLWEAANKVMWVGVRLGLFKTWNASLIFSMFCLDKLRTPTWIQSYHKHLRWNWSHTPRRRKRIEVMSLLRQVIQR